MVRDQRVTQLNSELASRLNNNSMMNALGGNGADPKAFGPLRDDILLEHMSKLHENVEGVKASLHQTSEVI